MRLPKTKENILKEFRTIPSVGVKISEDLWELGFRSISELKNQKPEQLYERLCIHNGYKVDRCMLYVFRTVVYFASNTKHNPELLKWWNWKEKN